MYNNQQSIKYKIKTMLNNKIRPAILTSKNGDISNTAKYKSSYLYVDWDNKDQHVENIHGSLVSCIYDYPENYIYLAGYLDESIYELYNVYIPEI